MTEVKSEITLKFNELPEATPAPNKKVEILLTDQNGVVFTALINAKSWRKAEADATAFSDWGGSVSGIFLGNVQLTGLKWLTLALRFLRRRLKNQIQKSPQLILKQCPFDKRRSPMLDRVNCQYTFSRV